MNCPNCGAETNDSICPVCGAALDGGSGFTLAGNDQPQQGAQRLLTVEMYSRTLMARRSMRVTSSHSRPTRCRRRRNPAWVQQLVLLLRL